MIDSSKASADLIKVQVELYGHARIISGRRQVEIAIPGETTTGDAVAALAKACPEIVGHVIRDDRSGLQESYVFNLNGTAFVPEGRLSVTSNDAILLFSSLTGG